MGNALDGYRRHLATTSLLAAAKDGDLLRVQDLLQEGYADVNVKDEYYGMTLLHRACERNDFQMAKCLIENGRGRIDVNTKSNNGETPLPTALHYGHYHIIKLMIENGAHVNGRQEMCGWTLLHQACARDNLKMVQLLIDNGADVNARDDRGRTPLIENGGQDFYYAGGLRNPHRRVDNLEIFMLLIENGADVNAKNNNGETALHQACKRGHLSKVQLILLQSRGGGANHVIDAKTIEGDTPLHLASRSGHLEIVWFLLREYPWLVSER